MHVEREQPAEEVVSSTTAPIAAAPSAREVPEEFRTEKPRAEKPKPAAQPERRRKVESADSRQSRNELRDAAPPPELQKAPEPAAAPPQPSPAQDAFVREQNVARIDPRPGLTLDQSLTPAPEAKPAEGQKAVIAAKAQRSKCSGDSTEGARAASSLSAFALQSPEQWLQGIADLRKQGRHEEADKELTEFRKRYPEYKIPPAMRERVERR
jgi:hypothetical protein